MVGFIIRDWLTSLPTLWMLWQFILLAWLDKRLPRWAFAPLIAIFVIENVIYNAVIGSWKYLEWPREWLYTDRMKRMRDDPRAARSILILNYFNEGHV